MYLRTIVLAAMAMLLCACGPEVGSEEWCKDMTKKKQQDLSMEEGQAFMKHCVMNKIEVPGM
ncbi:DUF3012 domain-containing protein [Teredinibacter turnerae]|uniref:DUF3012 domain-containing protein n=1 Tax=Teredinibacter turnerae TaxID=2426 RepID=UPI00037B6247|nr:DUF3012 domain-containing protein [Teredinibacter turnerae]